MEAKETKKAILQVSNLSFAYEDKPVLKDISLSVYAGEKIAVMGSNGAGKSTFFLNLNGVLTPDRGEIFLEGKQIKKKELSLLRKKVGFVFQDADSQIIASNVRAEISFGPMNQGLSREEVMKRVEDAISYLSLEELKDRAPHYLSGGEKKRVSIADILAMKPEILLFDEPMAALDPVNMEKVEQILCRLHEDGKTLLIATHDVDFAYRFADRILVLYEGRMIADASPEEIFHRKDILERAHLKAPGIVTIWEAMIAENMIEGNLPIPKTPEMAVQNLLKERRSFS